MNCNKVASALRAIGNAITEQRMSLIRPFVEKPLPLVACLALTTLTHAQTDGTAFNDEAAAADQGDSKVRAPERDHSVYAMPADLGDGLQIASLESSSADFVKLMDMARRTAAGEWKKIDSILIAHGGKLLFEDYYHGGHIDEPHTLMSITKSVTACLAGYAFDAGLIEDLNDPLIKYFPWIRAEDVDPAVATIKVHDVLSSRSGLVKDGRAEKPKISGKGLQAEVSSLLLHASGDGVGTRFQYGNVNTQMLGMLICAVTGKSLTDYADETLFKDLGIEKYKWQKRGGSKVHSVGAGLDLRSRDMMKIGLMVAQGGTFNGQRILSEDYVKAMTGVYHYSKHMGGYGYLWWSTGVEEYAKDPYVISGRGAKGQFIFIRPDLDLVAVFTSNNRKAGRKAPFDIFADIIAPAFM
ncbi:MAG: serine hydrolase domain-containing protein [Opitutales bacterium]